MGPLQSEIVHPRSPRSQVGGMIRRFCAFGNGVEIGGRCKRTEWWCGRTIKRGHDFLGNVQDRLDAPLYQSLPVASIVLRPKPNARDDLYWPFQIWHRR